MPASVVINPRAFATALDNLSERQLPFATMRALNEIALSFQTDEQNVMKQGFIIRRPWVLQGIKIDRADFATKTNLRVRVHVDDTRGFLNKFEDGDPKTPISGKGLAVPVMARKSAQSLIPDSLRPKALDFQPSKQSSSSFTILEGQQDTFLVQGSDGRGFIFQRMQRKARVSKRQHGPMMVGHSRDYALKLLYVLTPRAKTPPSLHFLDTARRTFMTQWPSTFAKWWQQALATARPDSL